MPGDCSCITDVVPTEDPHERRLVRVVADPECGNPLHRLAEKILA